MKLIFERDSVCAADDIYAPNTIEIEISSSPLHIETALTHEKISKYLPSVSRSATFWAVFDNKRCVAKIKHSGMSGYEPEIEIMFPQSELESSKLFFQYEGQKRL